MGVQPLPLLQPHPGWLQRPRPPLGLAPRLASAQEYVDHAAYWVDVLGLMSHQRTIPSSVDELPNGKFPRNAHLAGSTKHFPVGSEMAKRYPNGVPFNEKGFPVFDEWVHEIDGKPMDLQLPPNTWELSRAQHDSILDGAAGISAEYRQQFGLSWHHHEQPGRMQLIPTELNSKVGHTGGYNIWGKGK